MSAYSRSIKKIRRQCNIFKLNADVIIDNIYIFSVHQIPIKIEYGQSFDFWINEPNNYYLLDIEKSTDRKIEFIRPKWTDYLFCKLYLDFEEIDLKEIINTLHRIGIPKRFKGKISMFLDIQNIKK